MAPSWPRSGSGGAGQGPERHEPQGIGAILRGLLAEGPFRRGVAVGRLSRSWPEIAGPELAARTAPRALEDGVLLVAAASAAWGVQVRFLAHDIRRRANETLEGDDVRSVRVMVASEARKPLRRNGFSGGSALGRMRGTDLPE